MDQLGNLVYRERLDLQVLPALQDHLVLRVPKARLANLEVLGPLGCRVQLDRLELEVLPEQKGSKAPRVL